MEKDNTMLIVVVVLFAFFIFGGFGMMGFGGFGGGMMNWAFGYNTGFFWPMMLFMMIIWILVIVILILGIMWLVKQLQAPQKGGRR